MVSGLVRGPSLMPNAPVSAIIDPMLFRRNHGPTWWHAYRADVDARVLTGTAAGIAKLLTVDVSFVRAAFVVLGTAGGLGVVLYFAMWVLSQIAKRNPLTPLSPPESAELERTIGLGLATLGLLLGARVIGFGFVDSLVWPIAALAASFVVAAHQTDLDVGAATGVTGGHGTRTWIAARIGGGLLLAILGIVALLAFNLDVGAARDILLAAVVLSLGVALVLGPWIWRTANELFDERRRRVRSEERSELAAQLHDSVLQTLALIQRNQEDPQTMVNLARRQERELRSWLHGDGRVGLSERLKEGLETAATHVEELHGIPIEVVVVGDVEADNAISGLIMAAREAMHNAAKHSGSARIDVFAEVAPASVDVFVRDTGAGFDLAAIPADRRGIRDSIEGRMHRLGGSASIHASIGNGTEVEMTMPRNPSS